MMGISNQDLVFKLKSIGVRVEGDDAAIDTDIIQAILQGKKLPHPREVILRDEQTPVEPARRRTAAPPPQARRPAANPLRPNRPRTLIQKVEPRIQTLPASERQMAPFPFEEGEDELMMEAMPLHQESELPSAEPVAPAPPMPGEDLAPEPAMAAAATAAELASPPAAQPEAPPHSAPSTAPRERDVPPSRREPLAPQTSPAGGDVPPVRRGPMAPSQTPQEGGYIHPSRRGPLPPPLAPASRPTVSSAIGPCRRRFVSGVSG